MQEFDFDAWIESYANEHFPKHKKWYIELYKNQRNNGMGYSEDERWARLQHTQKKLQHLTTAST